MPAAKPSKKSRTVSSSDSIVDNPAYIISSTNIIKEALRKGQDVVQLDNGDIVTTETRTITTRYEWDDKAGRLVRATSKRKKSTTIRRGRKRK